MFTKALGGENVIHINFYYLKKIKVDKNIIYSVDF